MRADDPETEARLRDLAGGTSVPSRGPWNGTASSCDACAAGRGAGP
jgi:hypothetical protein